MTRRQTIGLSFSLTFLWMLCVGGEAYAGSLYRCVTEKEGIIYTDNPAQLNQCTPITASGAVTSLDSVSSGGPPASTPPTPPPVTPAPPDPPVMVSPPPGSSPPISDVAPSSGATHAPPCPVGINPLNPLSGPPCPPAEPIPARTITMPSEPVMPPGSPTQP